MIPLCRYCVEIESAPGKGAGQQCAADSKLTTSGICGFADIAAASAMIAIMAPVAGSLLHGRCVVARDGIAALLKINREQSLNLALDDVGVEVMKKLIAGDRVRA